MILSETQIAQLSRAEKVQLMEAIWADLSRVDDDVESPDWHGAKLQETESRYIAGEERIVDWEEAKEELWKRVE